MSVSSRIQIEADGSPPSFQGVHQSFPSRDEEFKVQSSKIKGKVKMVEDERSVENAE
jgi:hypothetical protein